MFRIRKVFKFEAAHQLAPGCHTEACSATLHGHSYKVEVFLTANELDTNSMVIDFGALAVLKSIVEEWDHAVILTTVVDRPYHTVMQEWNQKVVVVDYNPTAENMALDLFDKFRSVLQAGFPKAAVLRKLRIEGVRVHETDTGWAEYTEFDESLVLARQEQEQDG